ncbi:MAG: replication-relaxation family protein [Salinibacter sp.]|uniref:replication-relaxation family protein n=1 Tax=Salinibacter sp. TaxID=2065818 RepID=UPI0035D4D461
MNIIRAVRHHRLLRSRSHILPLFGGSRYLLRRLKKLFEHRFLYRLPGRRPHEEAVYALGNEGADLLNRRFGLPRPSVDYTQKNRRLGPRFIEHTLLVSDVTVAIDLACRRREDAWFISQPEFFEEQAPEPARDKYYTVGGHPLRWPVSFEHEGNHYRKSIEPDRLFGIETEAGEKPNWFFLEADRQNMPVKSRDLNRSSIFKKQLQYFASWSAEQGPNRFEEELGIRNARALFVLATGYDGDKRLRRCLEASEHFFEGDGTGLFLFVQKETLLGGEDPLTVPLTSGRRSKKTLLG